MSGLDVGRSWGLWSPAGINIAVKQPEQLALRVTVVGRDGQRWQRFAHAVGQPMANPPLHSGHRDDPTLGAVEQVALCWPGDPLFLDARLGLGGGEPAVRLRLASDGPELHGVIDGAAGQRVEVALEGAGAGYQLDRDGDGSLTQPFRFCVAPPGQPARSFALARCWQQAHARLHGAPFASLAPLLVNLCHEPGVGLYAPVSRSWTAMIGRIVGAGDAGPLIFNWDSALVAAAIAPRQPELASALVDSVLSLQQPDGRVAQVRCGDYVSPLSAPPVLAFAVEALAATRGVAETVLERDLAAIERWLDWFGRARRVGWHPLLLGWGGSDRWQAALESGMDDSPVWEEARFDDHGGRFETAAVDLNCLVAAAHESLAIVAGQLGQPDRAAHHTKRAAELGAAIATELWCKSRQLFLPRNGDGSFVEVVTPTTLYPLLLDRLPEPARVARLLAALDDPQLLGGTPAIPSLARSDRRYNPDGDYWRGRIWPPLNWLVQRGLARVDPARAERLAAASHRLYVDAWRQHGHGHENYSALTGRGAPQPGTYARSCPLYTWSLLLW